MLIKRETLVFQVKLEDVFSELLKQASQDLKLQVDPDLHDRSTAEVVANS